MTTTNTEREGTDQTTIETRGTDRRTTRHYVFRDRRTGFDRRHHPNAGWWSRLLEALRANPRLLEIFLVLVVALNLADIVFTKIALAAGAIETNPVMAALFDNGFMAAAGLKMLVSLAVVFIILVFRRYRKMLALTVFATGIYTLVLVYHLVTTPAY